VRRIVFFFGIIGSGKGTLTDLLGDVAASTGHRLHAFTVSNLLAGDPACKAIMDRGDLCSDEVVCETLDRAITPLDYDTVIVDGFPRSIGQAEHVLKIAKEREVLVLHFAVSDETAIRRCVGRNRGNDDREETVRYRLKKFYETSLPGMLLLEKHIPEQCCLVDGEPQADEVLLSVRSFLGI
jgi:adenylate kinase